MPTEIKVPVVDAVNVSIFSRPSSPRGSYSGVVGEDETATAREDGRIERPVAASKKRDKHDALKREGRAAPTKRQRHEKTEHPEPPALGVHAFQDKNAGKWQVQLSYLGRVVTLRPFDIEQALLVNRVLRGELEGKRNPELTAEEIESNIKLAKEAVLRALPEFKDGDNKDEFVSTYSAVAKVSEPPCDGTAPAKCPMSLREFPQSRLEEERELIPPPVVFGIGTQGKGEIRLKYGGRQLALRPLTEEQALLANQVLREKLKPEMKSKTSRLSAGEIESNIAIAKEAALGALSKFKEGIETKDFVFKVVRLKNLIDKHSTARRRVDDSCRIKDSKKKPPVVGVYATGRGTWRAEFIYLKERIYMGKYSVWEHAVLVNRVVREGLKVSRKSKLSKEEIRSNRKLAMEAAMEALSDFKSGAADRVEALIARVQRESVKNQSCMRGKRSDSDMLAYECIPGVVDRRPGKWISTGTTFLDRHSSNPHCKVARFLHAHNLSARTRQQEEGADTKDFISKVESRQKNSIVEHSPAWRRADDSRQIKDSEKKPPVVGVSATASGKWRVEVTYYKENIYGGIHSLWEHAVLVNRVVREGLKASRKSKLSEEEIRSNRKLAIEAAMEALSDFKSGAADRTEALIARVQRESVKNQSCTRGKRVERKSVKNQSCTRNERAERKSVKNQSCSDKRVYKRIPGVIDRRPGKWQVLINPLGKQFYFGRYDTREQAVLVNEVARGVLNVVNDFIRELSDLKDGKDQPPIQTESHGLVATASGKWRVEIDYQKATHYIGTFESKEQAMFVSRVARRELKATRELKLTADEIERNVELAEDAACEALINRKSPCPTVPRPTLAGVAAPAT